MSYPQPNPDLYAKNRYPFFRLNTPLLSDGDIYESPQTSNGLAVGPDSDIANINVAYFDDQVSGFMNQLTISPQRPFPGNLVARNESKYAPSSRPGRMLIWPGDLYNVSWRPGSFDPGNYRIDFITPVLDVIEYFSPVGGQPQYRNDKNYQYQAINFSNAAGGFWGLVVPFYGRRYASVFFANQDLVNNYAFGLWGLTYPQSASGMNNNVELKQIRASADVASGMNATQLVKADTDGMFDALFLRFGSVAVESTTDILLRIRTSDREA